MTCKTCKSEFKPNRKWQKFCSVKCRRKDKNAYLAERERRVRAERKRDQVCARCKAPIELKFYGPRTVTECEICRRKRVEHVHKKNGYKRYYNGAITSPFRIETVTKEAKLNNPYLVENWKEIELFFRRHFELWKEKLDPVLDFRTISIEDASPSVRNAYYGFQSGLSLEDYVISEIDKQRERWMGLC